jgi:CheY-like chemotaxis protein
LILKNATDANFAFPHVLFEPWKSICFRSGCTAAARGRRNGTEFASFSFLAAVAVYLEKRGEIALVILDMIMPEISGGETFDRLKKINPDVRVLLSSGYSIDGQAREILERGCRGFLQKPFRLKELSRKIREVLD